jgi:hypothetical protein
VEYRHARILAAVVFYAIAMQQSRQLNRVRNGFSQIDVQLTCRYDLIPGSRGGKATGHERGTKR